MHNRIVVVNSTPIIALAFIQRLDLFKALYEEVYIPKAVYDEVMIKENSKAQTGLARAREWIITKSISNNEAKKFFKVQLHEGEVEVMILGREINADLLVIDDYMAREYARYLDFKVTGSLGVLLRAKEKGIIQKVKPSMEDFIENGIYIGDKLYHDILEIAGED